LLFFFFKYTAGSVSPEHPSVFAEKGEKTQIAEDDSEHKGNRSHTESIIRENSNYNHIEFALLPYI